MKTMPSEAQIEASAFAVLDTCRKQGLRVTTAESCTGGLIVGALTEIAGSSDVIGRGFVTYSNEAKMAMLGVQAGTLSNHGAVSGETVLEMAAGALEAAADDADIAVAVSGVAGPGGGSPDKPVGTVWLAVQRKGQAGHAERQHFSGDRRAVRIKTVGRALELLLGAAK